MLSRGQISAKLSKMFSRARAGGVPGLREAIGPASYRARPSGRIARENILLNSNVFLKKITSKMFSRAREEDEAEVLPSKLYGKFMLARTFYLT